MNEGKIRTRLASKGGSLTTKGSTDARRTELRGHWGQRLQVQQETPLIRPGVTSKPDPRGNSQLRLSGDS